MAHVCSTYSTLLQRLGSGLTYRMLARSLLYVALTLALGLPLAAFDRKVIQPKEFPSGRPYSAALLIDNTLYISGQLGADWKTGKYPDNFEAEIRQCMQNVAAILKEAHMGWEDVVTVQVFLTDLDLFERFNAVYLGYFKEPLPTRTTAGVANLVGPARVEISVTAYNSRGRYLPMRTNP